MRHLPLLAFCLLVVACGKPERPHPQGPGLPASAADAQVEQVPNVPVEFKDSALTPEQRKVVLARIGERQITLGELEARLALEPPVVRSQFASVQKRKDYLQKLVQFEVLAAEAKRRGLDRDPEVIEALKQAMVRRYLQEVAEDQVKPDSLTDAELQKYYDANPGLYHKPEQVEVSHMLFSDKAKAEQVAQELRAGSANNPAKLVAMWNDYVGRVSEDKVTAPYLGSLGLVSKVPPPGASEAELERLRRVPQPVVEAAFQRNVHDIGSIVQSERGWHVIMVTSKSPAVDTTFDEVKESIRGRILKRERDLRRQQLLEQLRAKAKVEVNDDAVRLIPQPKIDRAPKLDLPLPGHEHGGPGEPAPGGHEHPPGDEHGH